MGEAIAGRPARGSVGGAVQDAAMAQIAQMDISIFDAPDIDRVGTFYAELTGWEVVRRNADRFGLRAPDGQEVEFQHAPDHVAPQWPGQERPQQFHLDLQIDDHQAAADRAVALGVTRVADGASWVTLTDPAYPQQANLDLLVRDLDAAEAVVLERGATRLKGGGERFRVFADPAGHPFCLVA
jgi:predicted enzyme related to lactoylglutathione lyase